MQVDTAVAKILKMEGIEFSCGYPYAPLQNDLAKEGIRTITFRSERVAVEASIGYARSTFGQRIGFSSIQGGPGLEVAFAGIREAYSDSAPVLVTTGGDPVRRLTTEPNFNPIVQLRGVTKMVESITIPDRTCEIMRRAFTALRMGRPRPVVVELPESRQTFFPPRPSIPSAAEFPDDLFDYKPVKPVKFAGDPSDVKEVAKALVAAKNPVIRAGQGVLYAMGWNELRELAELLEIPVVTTLEGKGAFPENHPLSLGAAGRTQNQAIVNFFKKADLILLIGESNTTCHFTTPLPPGKTVMHVTIDSVDINKDYIIAQAVLGDAKLVMRQLIDEIKSKIGTQGRRGTGEVARQIKADKEEYLKKWMPKLTSNDVPIDPYRVFWDVMHTVDRNKTIVTADSGFIRDVMTVIWETHVPGGFIGYGKDHMMGSTLGFIMGAKLANPDKFCINFMGDGCLGQVGMNLETAVRAKIPITTIVNNNGEFISVKENCPEAAERYDVHALTGDYRKVAEALGLHSERVERPENIIPAVQRAKQANDSGVPAFIEYMGKADPEIPLIVGHPIGIAGYK